MHPMSNTAIIESFAKRVIHKKVRKTQCSTSLVQIVPSHPSVKYFPKAAQNFGMKQLTATTTATRHPDLQASTSLDGWDPKGAQEETIRNHGNRLQQADLKSDLLNEACHALSDVQDVLKQFW